MLVARKCSNKTAVQQNAISNKTLYVFQTCEPPRHLGDQQFCAFPIQGHTARNRPSLQLQKNSKRTKPIIEQCNVLFVLSRSSDFPM